jgi:c-di-AMP phosphodiesterase-like protein
MEQSNKVIKYQEDFSEEENKALQEFIKNGCPGLTKIDEDRTFEWFRLYMSGKNYGEIASICNVKKELVLYIGNKLKWNEKRMSYYSEISSTLLQKTVTVKAESANTIATMVSALNQYFGDKFINYLRTKDSKHIEGIDSKMLAQYYKSLEMLDKLVPSSPSVAATPAVNINVGSNAKIEQSPNGDVTVTTDDSAKEILSALAKYKKKLSEEDEG